MKDLFWAPEPGFPLYPHKCGMPLQSLARVFAIRQVPKQFVAVYVEYLKPDKAGRKGANFNEVLCNFVRIWGRQESTVSDID